MENITHRYINCSSITVSSYHQYLEFDQSLTFTGHEVLEQITKGLGLNKDDPNTKDGILIKHILNNDNQTYT